MDKTYKEITVEEADVLFYAGCEFECAMHARDSPHNTWDKWVWSNTPPSMYDRDLFRVEVE